MWYQGLPITQYLRTWAPLALGISAANVFYADAEGAKRWKIDLTCEKRSRFTQEEREREREEMEMQHLLSSNSSQCQPIILNIVISSSWHHLSSISLPLSLFYPVPNTKEKIIQRDVTSELQRPLSVPHSMTALLSEYYCSLETTIKVLQIGE